MSGGGSGRPSYLRSAPIRRLRHPLDESPAWALIGACLWGLLGLTLALPLLIILAIVLPTIFVLRWFLLMLYWNRQRTRHLSNNSSAGGLESMRGNDSRWLGTSWHCSVLHAVLMFETPLDVSFLQQLLMSRIVPIYPRLTRRPVSLPLVAGAGYCWMPDCNFSIENHVFPGPNMPSAEPQIQEYVSQLLRKGLSNDKPPWELHVLRQCAILRVHQSVADGASLVKLLCHCLADTKIISSAQNRRRPLSFYCDILRACLLGPLSLLFWLLTSSPDYNLLTQSSTDCKGGVKVTWSAAISFAKVTRVKQVTRSTVNCVLLSALSGALRCLLQNCGVRQPPDLKVLLPVDLRKCIHASGTRLGNKMSPVVISLPVGMEGAVPRLWSTRKILNTLKRSTDPVIVYVATAALMSLLPGHFARKILSNIGVDKASLQFSSQIGPTSNIMMGGCTLKSVYALLPAQSHLNVAVSVLTYGDQLFVTVATDHTLGPAGNIILHHLQAQIDLLYNLLKYRRVPGEVKTDSNVYRFPDVTRSPVREIAYRLNYVQEEVQRLSRHEVNESEKLQRLKAEFSHLLRELRKRKSSNSSEQDIDLWDHQFRSRRRSMSCSFTRRSSVTLLSLLSTNRPVSYIETTNISEPIRSLSPSSARMTSPIGYKLQQRQQKQGQRHTTNIADGITDLHHSPNEMCCRRTSTPVCLANRRLTEVAECPMCHKISQNYVFRIKSAQRNFIKSYSQPTSVNESLHYKTGSYNCINKIPLRNFRSQPIVQSFDTTNLDNNDFKNLSINCCEYLCNNLPISKKYRDNYLLVNKDDNNRILYTNCEHETSNDQASHIEACHSKILGKKTEHGHILPINSQCESNETCCFIASERRAYDGRNNEDRYDCKVSCCNPSFDVGKEHIGEDNSFGGRNIQTDLAVEKNGREDYYSHSSGLYDEILDVIRDNKPLSDLYSYSSDNSTVKFQNNGNNSNAYTKTNKLKTTRLDDIKYSINEDEEEQVKRKSSVELKKEYKNASSSVPLLQQVLKLDYDKQQSSCSLSSCSCRTDKNTKINQSDKKNCCLSSRTNTTNLGNKSGTSDLRLVSQYSSQITKDRSVQKIVKKQSQPQIYDTAIKNLSNFASKIHLFSSKTESNAAIKNYSKLPSNNSISSEIDVDSDITVVENEGTNCHINDSTEDSCSTYRTITHTTSPKKSQLKCSNCNCITKDQKENMKVFNNKGHTIQEIPLTHSQCRMETKCNKKNYFQQPKCNSSSYSGIHNSSISNLFDRIEAKSTHNPTDHFLQSNLHMIQQSDHQKVDLINPTKLLSISNTDAINLSQMSSPHLTKVNSKLASQLGELNKPESSLTQPTSTSPSPQHHLNTMSLYHSSMFSSGDTINIPQPTSSTDVDVIYLSRPTSPTPESSQILDSNLSSASKALEQPSLITGIYRTHYRNSMDKLRTLQGSTNNYISYNNVVEPIITNNNLRKDPVSLQSPSTSSSSSLSLSHHQSWSLTSTLAFEANSKPNTDSISCDNKINSIDSSKASMNSNPEVQSHTQSFYNNSFSYNNSYSPNTSHYSCNNKIKYRPPPSSSFNNYDKVTFI